MPEAPREPLFPTEGGAEAAFYEIAEPGDLDLLMRVWSMPPGCQTIVM